MIAACPFPAPRGTPVRILRMAEELGRRGHEVHVVTYHLGEPIDSPLFKIHRIARVPTYRKMDPGPSVQKLLIVDPLLAWKVMRVAARVKPDIIHAHHYEGMLAALPAKIWRHCPVVFDAHVLLDGELEYYSIGVSHRMVGRIARFLDSRIPRQADHVISISEEIRDQLRDKYAFPDRLISIVPNGVEDLFFRGRSDAFPRDGVRRVIFTGNLALYQGADLMLEAFAKLLRKRSDVRLVIVTDSDSSEFKATATSLGILDKIEFLPPRLELLPGLISSADAALNPRTTCPGVPLKLLNYMAAGAAVISFRGSSKYLVHEQSGMVIEGADTDSFADSIARVLDDEGLRKRIGQAAREFATANLTWTRSAQTIEQVYDGVLEHRDGQARAR
jgi:glycosyltransferase involved in cell wall biosynthesis